MTVFVYISRRLKIFGRPKKQLPPVAKPSNLSWKIPLRRRWQPRRFLNRIYWRYRRFKLLYSIAGPPSNLSWKQPLRRRWQPRRFLNRVVYLRGRAKKLLYSIAGPPSNLSWKQPVRKRWQPRRFLSRLFVQQRRARLRYQPFPPPPAGLAPTKHAFRIRIKRGKRFVKTPKLYSIAGPPVGLAPTKHMFRIRIKRGKRFVKIPKLYSIAGPPVGFVAAPPRRRLRLHSRPMPRFFRPRVRGAIVPPPLVLFRALRRLRLKRRVLRAPHARYPVMAAPVGFVPFKKPPRPKIKRARKRLAPRNYSILPTALVLFRKLPRLRIKRARRFVRYPRTYSIAGPPVGFIATKRMLRPRIRRAKFRLRPRVFPILPSLAVLFRKVSRLKIKRARHLIKLPRNYPIAGPPASFVPWLNWRVLQLHSTPLRFFFRPKRRAAILPSPPVVFKRPPRGRPGRFKVFF